ncbi:MAG: Ldh family oxidoreductase [Bacteroidales bacterium]|nr:Ldh family oxidoreductase [Bacteroidales bacterium]
MYSYSYLFRFTQSVFEHIGLTEREANQASEILMRAELRNISTHGLVRLPEYISLWKNNRITVKPEFKILHETPSTALVDGGKGLGLVTAPKAMNLAIEKAEVAGTGWVAVRNSYHFGIAGYYAMKALEKDMIGITMTNANPLVAPTFSLKGMLGTNPIAVAIPAKDEPPFVADFATAPVSRGKVDEWYQHGESVPEGLVQDERGILTNDAFALQNRGAIRTLGGDRVHASHKGYCISAIVDIFSAVFSGANFGPTVVPTLGYVKGKDGMVDNGIGHFFGAMRIDAFQTKDEFKKNMDDWIRTFRAAEPVEGEERVLIPGDPEREAEAVNMLNGIKLGKKSFEGLKSIAEEFDLDFDTSGFDNA